MSLFPGTLFGRRKTELPSNNYHQTCPGYGVSPRTTTPPYHHHVTGFYGEQPQMPSPMVNSHVEWKETPEAHVYKAHLPGLKQSDVRVEVDDDRVLCIICERSVEKEEQRDGWHRVEVSSGQFVQRLTLPENSKVDHVKAYMDNGVLTIHVPKHRATINNRTRNIQISHV